MGAPKQKWTPEEETALKAGVLKHGPGNGGRSSRIHNSMEFCVCDPTLISRERARLALKRTRPAHKRGESSIALSTISQSDEEMVDPGPLAASGGSSPTDGPKRTIMRLDNLIIEAINKLKEPGGSNKTTIAAYIEDQFWAPPNFKRKLSAKLRHVATTGKLIKMKRENRIAVTSKLSERGKNPSVSLHEGRQKISLRIDCDDVSEKSQIDLELAKMRCQAEAAMAEAEIAA